jgi:spore germination protein GerM
VAIYFSQSHGSRVVLRPVKRSVPPQLEKNSPDQPKDQTLIAFSLLELLQGPSDEESAQGLYSEIPKGTRLLRLTSGPQRVDLNVSRQFVSGGGSNSMAQRLAELKTTVFEAQKHAGASKKPVYLAVEGQPLKLLGGEGIIVDEPLTPTEP